MEKVRTRHDGSGHSQHGRLIYMSEYWFQANRISGKKTYTRAEHDVVAQI